MTPRHAEFRIAMRRAGSMMPAAARELGVSYKHLILVLDGEWKGSATLDAGISQILPQSIAHEAA